MPLQATSGAASYDGFGGNGVPVVPNYIEEVFSTYLYTGNGSTQTITNGIDLSTNGGLVWLKARTAGVTDSHGLFDTARGVRNALFSDSLSGQIQVGASAGVTNFGATGFTTVNNGSGGSGWNNTSIPYASWTFRKQPKFFDIVTFTTDSTLNQRISHSLNSVPGCIIIKATGASDNWYVYHRTLGRDKYLRLQSTAAVGTIIDGWGTSDPTSTDFGISYNLQSGSTACVAYLFAHNAGGFGLTGTDNVISCGSFTADSSGYATVNLGYEPQFLITKVVSAEGYSWRLLDTMRGWSQSGNDRFLTPNSSSAEGGDGFGTPTATGFEYGQTGANTQHIYIAIRRGPMKVPTVGTSVFSPNVATTTIVTNTVLPSAGFPVDLMFFRKSDLAYSTYWNSRLLPDSNLQANDTAAEITGYPYSFASMTSVQKITNDWFTGSAIPFVFWQFRRAPSFFDEVCWTGDGASNRAIPHNLTVVPELSITKSRNATGIGDADSKNWIVRCSAAPTNYLGFLNARAAGYSYGTGNYWPTTSVWFGTGSSLNTGTLSQGNNWVNGSGELFVTYLFATCAGVSKVGSYTGTGTTLQINCGFTAGARFVMVKCVDADGDWYVWDSARGIVSGNDPYLFLNSTAAEVTNTDYIDPYSAGFEISSTAPAEINASGGKFIFLAIA
jgi:hypothetical protein